MRSRHLLLELAKAAAPSFLSLPRETSNKPAVPVLFPNVPKLHRPWPFTTTLMYFVLRTSKTDALNYELTLKMEKRDGQHLVKRHSRRQTGVVVLGDNFSLITRKEDKSVPLPGAYGNKQRKCFKEALFPCSSFLFSLFISLSLSLCLYLSLPLSLSFCLLFLPPLPLS